MRKTLTLALGAAAALTLAPQAIAGGGAPWFEDFDSYATGQDMHGVGGWLGWDNDAGATAFTVGSPNLSAPNSLEVGGGTDIVQTFDGITSGAWFVRTMVFIPADFANTSNPSWFILLNQFTHGGGDRNWSSQVQFIPGDNVAFDNDGFNQSARVPLVFDQWVELLYEIDLDNDSFSSWYDGQPLITNGTWSQGGDTAIDAIDLYANAPNGASPIYYDNMSITGVPAPGAIALLGIAGLATRRRRRN